MDEVALILNLVFRLGLTSEQYRVLRHVVDVFYDGPEVIQMPNAVAFLLQEYGIRGAREIVKRVSLDPTVIERVDNLDELLFS